MKKRKKTIDESKLTLSTEEFMQLPSKERDEIIVAMLERYIEQNQRRVIVMPTVIERSLN